MKRIVAGVIGCAATLLVGAAPEASADGYQDYAVADSYSATCGTFDEMFTGNVQNDTGVAVGVTRAIVEHYGFNEAQAVEVVNAQTYFYCYWNWPNLVAVGQHARGEDRGRLIYAT